MLVTDDAVAQHDALVQAGHNLLGVAASPLERMYIAPAWNFLWGEEIPEDADPKKIWVTICCGESYSASSAYSEWDAENQKPADRDEPKRVLRRSGMPLSFMGVKAHFGSITRKDKEYFA